LQGINSVNCICNDCTDCYHRRNFYFTCGLFLIMGIDAIKPAIYLAIITALIAGATAGYNAIEQSGYDRAQAELLEAHKIELVGITDRFKDELEAAKHEAKFYRQQAILLQDVKPVVLTKIKEKIVYENINTCTRINGLSELWNARAGEFTF